MDIKRDIYTDRIVEFIDNELIKVITGVRRCGKSFILSQLISKVRSNGVQEDHIIYLPMEDLEFEDLRDYKTLYKYITQKMTDDKKYYIFIDEIQFVLKWEEAINSLRLKNTDIYITGSNSKLLSGELATLLSGRYIEFKVNTVSFSEYVQFLKDNNNFKDLNSAILNYIKYGGYPLIITSGYSDKLSYQILKGYYDSIIYKDVIAHNSLKDEKLLIKIIDYLCDNVGNVVSIRNIANYIDSNNYKTNPQTVSSYVQALQKAFVIEEASRYNIAGKELLKLNNKFYLADHSFMYVRKGYSFNYINAVLENIVYNELVKRGYSVSVGQINNKEVDFVAENETGKIYVQVSYTIANAETFARELEPLTLIADNYPKYIVTMDELASGNKDGILYEYLPNFLLKKEF